jgi:hypothetical protein
MSSLSFRCLFSRAPQNHGKTVGAFVARMFHSAWFRPVLTAVAVAALPQLAEAQGVVDPTTVPLRELVREPGTALARPKFVRVDASGNIFVGTVSSTSTSSGFNFFITYSSGVRKYSPQGTLLWSRSRNLTSVANGTNPVTYFESWGDGPDHQISDQKYNVANVALAGMAIDSAGGVALVYDTYRVDTSFDPGSRTTISQTVSNNITLFVKLSSTGSYVNEYYSFPDTGGLYDQASQVKSFETMPNGSFVALIWNYNFTSLGGHSQSIVQRIANNGSSPDYTALFGSADRDASNRKKTSVDPIELGFSLIGEVYIATNDTPNPAVDFTGDSKHVIRRLDVTGNTTARIDIIYANSATGQSGDTWSGMKVESNGNCYVGGATKPDLQQNVQNQVALKYGPTLAQEVWRTVVTGNTGTTMGIQIGSLGSVSLAGTTNAFNSNLSGSAQWSVSRVSTTGGIVWHQFFAGQRYPGNSQTASGVVSFFVDGADNVFVYGSIPQPTLLAQVFGKFGNDGVLQFIKTIPSIYLLSSTSSYLSSIAFNLNGAPVFASLYYNGVVTNPLYAQAVLELGGSAPTPNPTALPPTLALRVSSSGYQNHNPWRFTVVQTTTASGRTVRMQYSKTPLTESSWTDFPGGGQMTLLDASSGLWVFNTIQPVPDSTVTQFTSFRAITAAPGLVDSKSNIRGPYTIEASAPIQPFVATITSPANGSTFNYDQGFTVSASFASISGLRSVELLFNNLPNRPAGTATSFPISGSSIAAGDYSITVSATNNLGETTVSSPVRITVRPSVGRIFDYKGPIGGDWNTPTNWTPTGVPGAVDSARILGGGFVSIGGKDITVGSLVIDESGIAGPGKLTIATAGYWTSGAVANMQLVVASAATLYVLGTEEKRFNASTLDNYGRISLSDTGPLTGDADSVFNNYGDFAFTKQASTSKTMSFAGFGSVNNSGRILLAGGTFKTAKGLTQTAGDIDVNEAFNQIAGYFFGDVALKGGIFDGEGFLGGNLTQTGGILSPGHSPGSITVGGNYTLGPGGTLALEVAGTDAATGQFDQLEVLGIATLNGTLNVRTINGFIPASGNTFNLLSYGSKVGTFATISSNAQLTFGTSGTTIAISGQNPPLPVSGPSARLVNLSVLTNVTSAGNFTMGYVVGGAGTSGSKPILIRAAGPTLGAAPFNISGTLGDPRLELFAGTTKTTENDNWGGTSALNTAFASVGAFAYVNATSLDAAVFTQIAPGDNSVRVSATGAGAGTVIAELYDSTPFTNLTPTSSRLVNVSVLKSLGTGLTIGFVIDGSGSKKVLIRAVGPTIGTAPFSVSGVVADPQLTLFSGQSSIGSNDNWAGTAELTAAFAQVGAFTLPATSRDAALLAMLQPGNYTVQVSGVGGTTGVAIVEVYEVP